MNLSAVYRATGRELRAILLGIDLETFNEMKATEIQRKTRRLIATLHLAAERWTETDLMKGYHKSERQARTALEILGRKPKRKPMIAPEIGLKEDAFKVLYQANSSIQKTVEKYLSVALLAARETKGAMVQEFEFADEAEAISQMAQQAVLEEVSRSTLKKQILAHLKTLVGDDNFIEINGRYYQVGKYAEMVARTEMRNAATEATKDLCQQYDNDLVEVSDHGTICEICQEIEGNIYSLSGNHPKYPAMPIDFPPHPNCLHSLLPTSEEAISVRGRYA